MAKSPTNTTAKKDPFEFQTKGDYYSKLSIQPIEYCHANGIGAAEGAVIKYITRHQDKNGVEDLKKAIHTIQLLAKLQYGEII